MIQWDLLRSASNCPLTPTFSGGFSRMSTVMCSTRYTSTATSVSLLTSSLFCSTLIGGPSTIIVGIPASLLSFAPATGSCAALPEAQKPTTMLGESIASGRLHARLLLVLAEEERLHSMIVPHFGQRWVKECLQIPTSRTSSRLSAALSPPHSTPTSASSSRPAATGAVRYLQTRPARRAAQGVPSYVALERQSTDHGCG